MTISRGFTLIEVLVATLILFATLGAMTELLRTTLMSSGSAEGALVLSQAAAELQPQIAFSIEHGGAAAARQGGEGRHGSIRYRWSAKKLREAPRFAPAGEELGGPVYPPVILWNIELQIEDRRRQRRFFFKSLSYQ